MPFHTVERTQLKKKMLKKKQNDTTKRTPNDGTITIPLRAKYEIVTGINVTVVRKLYVNMRFNGM